jgi:hypothetical protein
VAQPENAHLPTYARLFFSHGNIAFTWCMYVYTYWQIMRIRQTGGNCSCAGLSLSLILLPLLPLFVLWSADLLTLPLPLPGIPINSSRSLSTCVSMRTSKFYVCANLFVSASVFCVDVLSYLLPPSHLTAVPLFLLVLYCTTKIEIVCLHRSRKLCRYCVRPCCFSRH